MRNMDKTVKKVFGDVPKSFANAVQRALNAILDNDRSERLTVEGDELQKNIVETFSELKASEGTLESVLKDTGLKK